jgi:signal transduction histidine kinase
MLSVGASYGLDSAYTALDLPVGGAITGRAVLLGEAVSVPNLKAAAPLLNTYLREPNIPDGWMEALDHLRERYNAVLAVPVRGRSHTYGAITLYYPQAQQFTDEVIGLAVAFAGQVALVIENARLRDRVAETAAIEERSRLARDLHDAVTQTLFSASLIADTLPDLWRIDEADAKQQLDRLGRLTRGALAEMRTLLVELRPARLAEADMSTLLQQLIDAAQGQSKLEASLSVHGNCTVEPDVKIALYRIAQEALNNVVKHAAARHVFVSLRCDVDQITLQVLDDGCGFDLDAIEAGHFGIQIMRERAGAIGAVMMMDTQPGEGTEIRVIWRKSCNV